MSESSEAVGGGPSASAAAPEVSTAAVPVEEGRGGTPLDDAPLGREGATQQSSPLTKKGGTYGSNHMNRLTRRKTI